MKINQTVTEETLEDFNGVLDLTKANTLVYDVEVYKEDYLVVFRDMNFKIVKIFHEGKATSNRPEYVKVSHKDLGKSEIKDFIKGKTLVGYNNFNYDDHILTAMIKKQSPERIKAINDTIISGKRYFTEVHNQINSIDIFREIDPSQPSLKKIEANMGHDIRETTVPFDLPRAMNDQELEETIFYCGYDVEETVHIYNMRLTDYVQSKQLLINRLPREARRKAQKMNTTSLAGLLLTGGKKVSKWANYHVTPRIEGETLSEWEERDRDFIDSVQLPEGVLEMWEDPNRSKKTVKMYGAKFEFSKGGLHGVNNTAQKRFKNLILLDVASLYPNIMVLLEILGIANETFKDMIAERIAIKHTDQALQLALKLIINKTYGVTNDKYNLLYNPMGTLSVCMFGQMALFDLCRMLHLQAGAVLVNINTDGVGFTCDNDLWKDVWKMWEQKWKLTLEDDHFKDFIQTGVNSYIGVSPDGHIKVKGADVGRLEENKYFKNNSLRIVDKCIVNKVLYNKNPYDTIIENLNDPLLFQMVLKVGRTYIGIQDDKGNLLDTKVNRVFATKEDFKLYKAKLKNDIVALENFPNTPDKMSLHNEEVSSFDTSKLDLEFYYDLATKALERWA